MDKHHLLKYSGWNIFPTMPTFHILYVLAEGQQVQRKSVH